MRTTLAAATTALALLVLTGLPPVLAADVPLDDAQVVLDADARRVGPVLAGMTLAELQKRIPAADLRLEKVPGPEGSEFTAAVLWKGTAREVEILYDAEHPKQPLTDARLVGRAWKLPGGLQIGATLAAVEKANGKPFQVFGFNWDGGGYANFEDGGALAGTLSLRFDPSGDVPDGLAGDRLFSSSDPALRAVQPKVSEITVFLTRTE